MAAVRAARAPPLARAYFAAPRDPYIKLRVHSFRPQIAQMNTNLYGGCVHTVLGHKLHNAHESGWRLWAHGFRIRIARMHMNLDGGCVHTVLGDKLHECTRICMAAVCTRLHALGIIIFNFN
jgi:hypothetical protein